MEIIKELIYILYCLLVLLQTKVGLHSEVERTEAEQEIYG
jgi:hypothetical protein